MLTHFDYVLPDGSGIAIAGKLLHAPIRENVNGTDMLPLLAEMAEKKVLRFISTGRGRVWRMPCAKIC